MIILFLSDHLSLHDTCAITISNLNGSKMAADIVRRQEGASAAASSRKTLRLTWQCERHAVCYATVLEVVAVQQQSLPPRSSSRCQPDGCPGNGTWQDRCTYCIPYHCTMRWDIGTPMLVCYQEPLLAWRPLHDSSIALHHRHKCQSLRA